MDIGLEFCDTYIFDYLYAAAFPAQPAAYNLKDGMSNSSMLDARGASQWQFHPASQLVSFPPTDAAYATQWTRDNVYRQALSLCLITWFGGAAIYFIVSTLSYIFIFDKTTFKHPKFLKNQIRMEIRQAASAMPFMAILTTPAFVAEVLGYSKLYDAFSDEPFPYYNWLQFPFFLLFTDCFVYFIHRGLHHPWVYKTLHKPHHKWIMPTPYASIAFHPVDGFLQSVPYHVFPFIFPLQKLAYLALFVFVQIWTVFIHDGEYVANSPILNGAACHTMHHLYFNYNYGQYTTLWDRLGGSYRKPNEELFRRESKMGQKEWERQSREMERLVKEIEGEDDRTYEPETNSKKDI
ncbi:putative C-5 sterol desaturase desaturase [Venustampulla echinocandica]|uniref:Putative C-5 sterol desaturase desaturase n=1 Tax=Venustampulla echinocandica TaxID=2656787 RepID=A0A370TIX8_9HELO|nr:putative C-5 sterol desaturase desaturase [Venustampulla echinocandica]RDL35306.1 putative C-5 sterol desaturase desaturase [Venustampulla echinocandica]